MTGSRERDAVKTPLLSLSLSLCLCPHTDLIRHWHSFSTGTTRSEHSFQPGFEGVWLAFLELVSSVFGRDATLNFLAFEEFFLTLWGFLDGSKNKMDQGRLTRERVYVYLSSVWHGSLLQTGRNSSGCMLWCSVWSSTDSCREVQWVEE